MDIERQGDVDALAMVTSLVMLLSLTAPGRVALAASDTSLVMLLTAAGTVALATTLEMLLTGVGTVPVGANDNYFNKNSADPMLLILVLCMVHHA